jgi:hypothetical protein
MFRVNGLFFAFFLCNSLQAASFQWLIDDFNDHFKTRIAECDLEISDRTNFDYVPQRETTGVIVRKEGELRRQIAYLAKFIGNPTIFRIQNAALQNRFDVDLTQHRIKFSTMFKGTVARAVSLTPGKTIHGYSSDYVHYYCRSGRVSYSEFRACLEENYVAPLVAQLCDA